MTRLRLAFMGTPAFAVPSLKALIDAGHDIACVYTQPPRPAGRGHKLQKSPVQILAEARGVPVRSPTRLRTPEAQADFAALGLDGAVVAAYGLILPPPVLAAPRRGCLNIHGSLLPRWRGAAPVQRAILAGDTETGITIMQMDAGLDTGAMLLRRAIPIGARTTAAQLLDDLATLGAAMILDALANPPAPTPQPEEGVTYAAKLDRDDGRLIWTRSALHADRQVRALTPWPGAWFDINGERIKVLGAELIDHSPDAPAGTVLDDQLTIACADGAIRLSKVQRAGKAVMEGGAFLRGFPLKELG